MSDRTTMADTTACGACEGLTERTPVRIENRPSLPEIAYRMGTWADFRASLLARLSTPEHPSIGELGVREPDDFTIALLDSWAVVADILTFYQERMANESYLRTATERGSILQLARAIGYELRPGVAGSAELAFTIDAPSGVPGKTFIPAGTPVRSLPAPGERPQLYETIEDIEARSDWNRIRPRLTKRHALQAGTTRLVFEGIVENLAPGDGVLFQPDGKNDPVFGTVSSVTAVPAQPAIPALPGTREVLARAAQTVVDLALLPAATHAQASILPNLHPSAPSAGPIVSAFAGSVPVTLDANALASKAQAIQRDPEDLFTSLRATPHPAPRAIVFRTRAAILGHNAPAFSSLPVTMTSYQPSYSDTGVLTGEPGPYKGTDTIWADKALNHYPSEADQKVPDKSNRVYLDNVYEGIVAGSLVVLRDGSTWGLYEAQEVADISRSAFTLTSKVTRLKLDSNAEFGKFGIRTTSVFANATDLPLARLPEDKTVNSSKTIDLDDWYPGLLAGRSVIVSGDSATAAGMSSSETHLIDKVEHSIVQPGGMEERRTRLTLTEDLATSYVRSSVTINANVAMATQGETVREVLGSGDGRVAFQRFSLRQSPLTWVGADNATGMASTLTVYVNDVRWHEVRTLVDQGPNDRVYTSRLDDDGITTITFGDGRTGARLPTGVENIRAVYRAGSGLDGEVRAGQLTMLAARPERVTGVTNPLPSSGADDPESLRDARRNAPLTVLTLDRIVSIHDYGDFARSFPGIDKAHATWTRSGERRGILITILGPRGAVLTPDSPAWQRLLSAIQGAGDPNVPVRIASRPPTLFRIDARIDTDPDHVRESVLARVERSLRSRFAIEERDFGQPVALSEVIATIHSVSGVQATDIDALYRAPTPKGPQPSPMLVAALPGAGSGGDVEPAELLVLDPAPMTFGRLT